MFTLMFNFKRCLVSDVVNIAVFKPILMKRNRIVTPFSEEKSKWIIFKYGEVRTSTLVRRAFMNKLTQLMFQP